jgi:hypothetical protein
MEKLTIVLTTRQRTESAMRRQGLSPATFAIKPGTRVQKDRKAETKRGVTKHKKNFYND